ncbi:MAG: HD domain-containing protein, partial [Chloroflexota bacterium]
MTFTEKYLSTDEARSFYEAGDSAHDFDHVQRVTAMAVKIATAENADVTVVRLAALLHDVPVDGPIYGAAVSQAEKTAQQVNARLEHHMASAAFARTLLTDRQLPTTQIDAVVHAIEAHRFRDQSIQPQSLEAKCLYDADKLDSMGAIGVGRCFAYAGAYESRLWTQPWADAPPFEQRPKGTDYTPVHEFVYKLQRLLETLHTDTARQIGVQRHQFMIDFFNKLDFELGHESQPSPAPRMER